MGISVWQIAVVVVLVVLLFGRGKISGLMGDLAQGIKSFRKGMREDVEEPAKAVKAPTTVEASAKDADWKSADTTTRT